MPTPLRRTSFRTRVGLTWKFPDPVGFELGRAGLARRIASFGCYTPQEHLPLISNKPNAPTRQD